MTKKIPRGPTPSLIGGANGRPRRVDVLRKGKCYRCEDTLLSGTKCIEIPKLGTGFSDSKRCCDECYEKIIAKTMSDLEQLKVL